MSLLLLAPYALWLMYQAYLYARRSSTIASTDDKTDDKTDDTDRTYDPVRQPPASAWDPSFDDDDDFADATRGFVAALEPGIVHNADGSVAWDADRYAFLAQPAGRLATVHPHLVRQGRLCALQGLFRVTQRILQVRALDISNMTLVEGRSGVVVIDPLTSAACAEAALTLYYRHCGWRPVVALVFSHSHADHYLGAAGVFRAEQAHAPAGFVAGGIPIIAPDGFVEAAAAEHVLAGPAMLKRAVYMYGSALPVHARGQVGAGLGLGASTGSTGPSSPLVVPNRLVRATGDCVHVDGVDMEFHMVPDTEAPAEFNLFFAADEALLVAETAAHCMHNITTLRGAAVRDSKAWSEHLDVAAARYGRRASVLLGSHHWPMWGRDRLLYRLRLQRDLYGFLHDQTVRLMNTGRTAADIAETLEACLPPAVRRAWFCRGYYGSLSHNVKGVVQRYLTWFDGDPAHLWPYPKRDEGRRYVACLGGVAAITAQARAFLRAGDARFAVTLLGHVDAAHDADDTRPDVADARALLATAFETLAFGTENATWRNFFLSDAQRLRTGTDPRAAVPSRARLEPALPVAQWFAILAVQIDAVRAVQAAVSIDVVVAEAVVEAESAVEAAEHWRLVLSNGVLTARLLKDDTPDDTPDTPDATLHVTRAQLLGVLQRDVPPRTVPHTGDPAAVDRLLEFVDR